MALSTRKWQGTLRLSKGVRSRLTYAPWFLLVVQEVTRRHGRDLPQKLDAGASFTTTFERDDLPGGALQLRTTASLVGLVSELSFSTGARA